MEKEDVLMPLLKFKCGACGRVFEEFARLSALSGVRCPCCGGEAARAYEGKCYGLRTRGAKGDGSGSGCSGCAGGHCGTCGRH